MYGTNDFAIKDLCRNVSGVILSKASISLLAVHESQSESTIQVNEENGM